MTLGSLFDGISGFPLAASWAGIETKWISEIDPYCLKVSKKNFPNAIQYGDIKELFEPEPVDIVAGGFPCQTFSLAGEGAMDMSLWAEMFRIIRKVSPSWVVAENVYGLVARKGGVALETVCSDLEGEGFTVFPPCIIPACAVEADHRRDRIWIIAHSSSNRLQRGKEEPRVEKAYKQLERLQPADTWTYLSRHQVNNSKDGLSERMAGLIAAGNAIVPQVAYEIFKAIVEIENNIQP